MAAGKESAKQGMGFLALLDLAVCPSWEFVFHLGKSCHHFCSECLNQKIFLPGVLVPTIWRGLTRGS